VRLVAIKVHVTVRNLSMSRAMPPDRWRQISQLYDAALTRGGDRAAFLKQACADDEELRLDVESLLAQLASPGAFLTQSTTVMAADAVSDRDALMRTGDRIGESQAQLELLTEGLASRYRIGPELGRGGMATVYRPDEARPQSCHKNHACRDGRCARAPTFPQRDRDCRGSRTRILPLLIRVSQRAALLRVMPYIDGEVGARARLDRGKQLSVEEALRLTREDPRRTRIRPPAWGGHRTSSPERAARGASLWSRASGSPGRGATSNAANHDRDHRGISLYGL
jgi:hypothetical protein